MPIYRKRRKKTFGPHEDRLSPTVEDLLNDHLLEIKKLVRKEPPIAFDQYRVLLLAELDRIKGYGEGQADKAINKGQEEHRNHREFLFKTFHDMRNPLQAIMGYAALVLRKTREQIPLNHQENLEKVIKSADQLKELVDKMVAYYREK
jgi:signal transduction histidine kinase